MALPNAQDSQPTSPDQGDGRSLLARLEDLGDGIVTADIPVDVRKVLGALVHFIETGSLDPPEAPTPLAEQRAVHESESENLRLQQKIRELEAAQSDAAAPAPAAPVEPAAVPPAAVPPADPAKPAGDAPPAQVVPPVPGSSA